MTNFEKTKFEKVMLTVGLLAAIGLCAADFIIVFLYLSASLGFSAAAITALCISMAPVIVSLFSRNLRK